MFEALGSRTYRWRYLIVVVWIVAMVASVKLAPSLADSASSDQAAFLPATAPSSLANDALERAFPGATATSSATLTFSRDTGLTDADTAYLDATAAWVHSPAAPAELRDAVTGTASATSRPELESMLKSPDGQLQLLLIDLNVSSAGDAASAVVGDLRAHIAQTAPAGLVVHVTGTAGITSDYLNAVKAGTDSTTRVTIILVLVILLLIYRAPLAAMVPLVTIAGAYVVSRGVLGLLAAAGWKVSSLLDTFLVVMVFGVGTDYAIFLISRFREEVSGGVDWHDASRTTVRRIGAVISASAATVIVGLGAMAFGQFEMIKSTGPAIAVAIAITLVAGLTLAPALLGIFGHYLFWPMHTRPAAEGEPGGFFAKLAAGVSRHPGVITLALIVALGLPAMFVQQMHTNFDTLAELPASSDARQGFDVVAAHLGKGKLVQSTGLIVTPSGDMLAPANLARLRDTVLALQSSPGVSQVTSLVTPNGDGKVPDGFRPSIQLGTIGDAFSANSSSSSSSAAASGSSSSLLDPKLTDGLDQALNYVGALGASYPDVAGRAEYRAARGSITAALDLVARVKKQTVVATQLRTLAAALTAPAAVASGSSASNSDASLMSKYLDELATAYPEVRPLAAYRDAVRSAASLATTPSATAAVDTANAMNALAVHFDSQPDSRLSPKSLANTSSALELQREAKATFAAIPSAFHSLASVFATRADDLFVPVGLGGDNAQKVTDAVNAFISADRTATRFYLVSADDPYATTSFDTVRNAQQTLAAAAPGFGPGAQAYLGGPTAQFADVQTTLENDFNRVGVITVLGIFLVLVLLLRAMVAPLYLVGTVLLSYLSAVGLSAFLFQDVLHHAGVSFYLPLMVFVLLVALGSDYNIFLMSRVREESEHRSIRDGIRIASGHTGSVITSAGLILAGTFGSMATAPLVVLFQVGVAVAIGVLIDTFVVRSILVPAITTLVGDRAWWPSGSRFSGPALAPAGAGGVSAPAASSSAVGGVSAAAAGSVSAALAPVGMAMAAAAAESTAAIGAMPDDGAVPEADLVAFEPTLDGGALPGRARRSLARAAAALGLAILVPVTFAGLVTWAWQPQPGAITIQAAVVNADTGATVTAGDGSTKQLALGKDISDGLVAGGSNSTSGATGASDPAASGLGATGVAWTATDAQAAADGLASGLYSAVLTIPADFSQDIAAIRAGTSGSTPSATLHLETGSGGGNVATAIARSVSDAITASATRNATASYVEDVLLGVSTAQSDVTSAASSAKDVANSATSLASSASGINAVSGEMVSGLDKLASGTSASASGTASLVDATSQLASGTKQLASAASTLAAGASKTASGASALAAGASSLASGLAALDAQTKTLPAQTSQLASGASDLAAGVSQTVSGIESLSAGLGTLASNTTGLGSQVRALDVGAASLASGAHDLETGASQAAAAAAGVSTGVSGLKSAVDAYTGSVDQLAANCTGMGGGATVCDALTAIANGSATVRDTAATVASGASQASAAAAGVATGAASTSSGADSLHSGLSQLAAGAPAIESGIASSAAGASALSAGAAQLTPGAGQLADGTGQLAAGMPQLAEGVSGLSSGASQTASGATQLSTGASALASGTDKLASGLDTTAAGATKLASGTKTAASGTTQLTDAISQALDGARVVQAETDQLATDGKSLSSDASKVSDSLTTTAGSMPATGTADRSQVAARVADPVTVQTTAADANPAGIAPLAMVLALWLGALAALLAVPSMGRGRRWWTGPLGAVGLATVAGLVAAGLMVAGLDLGVGIAIARLPMLVAVTLLAAAAFAMVIGALASAFGLRGWVAALLLAGLGVAASGYPFGVDALPGPLAIIRPLLPTSWAVDAIRACIESVSSSVAVDVAVLVAWLIVGALVVLAVTVGVERRAASRPRLTA
ncbi:MAG: MMPL family transporter [Candidatus Limnocylindrales bacterium]